MVKLLSTLDIKDFIDSQRYGVLSTFSTVEPDYPFGSITPYLVDEQLNLIIHISHLAEHTKNILDNPKVAITIFDINNTKNPNASPRICCIADAIRIDSTPDLHQRFEQRYPDAAAQLTLPGFHFYKLNVKRIRMIAGFGQMGWLEPQQIINNK